MSSNDENFIKEMVDIFKEQILEYSAEMRDLLAKSDYENLSKVAHKAKSSVAVMGMEIEKEMLNTLEINAKKGVEVGSYKQLVDTFIENATKAITELDAQMKK